MPEYEWRVARAVVGVVHPVYTVERNEYEAELHCRVTTRNYEYESSVYGLEAVWTERREVGPWEKVDAMKAPREERG